MKKLILFLIIIVLILFQAEGAAAKKINGLVVRSNEARIIENQELIVEGDITVEPNGKLIIRNSNVTLNSHYKNQYWIRVRDGGSLEIENSILRDGPVPGLAEIGNFGKINNFRLGESVLSAEGTNSKVLIRSSTVEVRPLGDSGTITIESSYCGIVVWTPFGGLKMNISNSNVQLLHIWIRGEKQENVYLSNLGKSGSVNLHLNIEKGVLNVDNTLIKRSSVALWVPPGERDCRKNVIIENSDLEEIFAVFPEGTNIKIWNMRPGFYQDWNIYDTMNGTGLPWNLTLKNVKLNKWKLDLQGIAEVENSIFHLDTWNSSNVVVKNSRIVANHHSRGGEVKFINTEISDSTHSTDVRLIYQPSVNKVYNPVYYYEFDNSTIGPDAAIEITDDNIHAVFRGNLSVKLLPENVYWFGGTITREYNIISRDGSDQTFILFDPDGNEVWEKTIGESGMLLFNLTFDKNNYTEEFSLKTIINNLTIVKKVGFFTGTPIVISSANEPKEKSIEVSETNYSMFFVILSVGIAIILCLIFLRKILRKH